MKKIIFGTTNPGKVAHVQAALDPLGIKVLGLSKFKNLPDIEEDGKTPQENSQKKAAAYCEAIDQPVLSMDNALYIDGLDDNVQPGMHVRRIPGYNGRPTDEEMLEYYSALIKKHGGNMTGHWEFSICLAFPNGTTKEITAISKTRYFTSKISPKRMPGYPLESIQIDKELGKYIVEMTKEESDQFWQESVGKELRTLFS
ncbi:MAG: non-canonical purine NTP pyrophosphatase [Patescibacteria group bacterium]